MNTHVKFVEPQSCSGRCKSHTVHVQPFTMLQICSTAPTFWHWQILVPKKPPQKSAKKFMFHCCLCCSKHMPMHVRALLDAPQGSNQLWTRYFLFPWGTDLGSLYLECCPAQKEERCSLCPQYLWPLDKWKRSSIGIKKSQIQRYNKTAGQLGQLTYMRIALNSSCCHATDAIMRLWWQLFFAAPIQPPVGIQGGYLRCPTLVAHYLQFRSWSYRRLVLQNVRKLSLKISA